MRAKTTLTALSLLTLLAAACGMDEEVYVTDEDRSALWDVDGEGEADADGEGGWWGSDEDEGDALCEDLEGVYEDLEGDLSEGTCDDLDGLIGACHDGGLGCDDLGEAALDCYAAGVEDVLCDALTEVYRGCSSEEEEEGGGGEGGGGDDPCE